MTYALPLIFTLFFVCGPLTFRMLTRDTLTKARMYRLVVSTWCFAIAGLGVQYMMGRYWGHDLWMTGASVLLIWFAWIGVLAFVAMVLRDKDPSARMHRWTAIVGAVGTTVPWFGLASASLIQG
jgi:hypothetical protein